MNNELRISVKLPFIKIKINRKNFWSSLFFITIMVYYTFVRSKIYSGIFKLLFVVAVGFAILHIIELFANKYKNGDKIIFKSLLLFTLFSLVVLYEYSIRSDSRILIMMLAMLCSLKIPLRLLFKELFWTKFLCVCVVLATGGYEHINLMSIHIGMTILLYFCTKKYFENLSNKNFLVLFFLYVVFWIYTDSGAFKIGMGMYIFMELMYKNLNGFKKILTTKIVVYIYPLLLFAVYFFSISINETTIPYIGRFLPQSINEAYFFLVYTLDSYMSSRLSLSSFSLKKFGISWFGGNVQFDSFEIDGHYFNLDSGMVWLIQGQGILMTIFIMVLSILLMKYLISNKMYRLIIIAIVISCWSANEDMLISIGMNFIFILMGRAVFYALQDRREIYEYTKDNTLLLVWRK